MATWTVRPESAEELLHSKFLELFITDPRAIDPNLNTDGVMRWAEAKGALGVLHANVGRSFQTEAAADDALFAYVGGGGFGIPTVLRQHVVNSIRFGDLPATPNLPNPLPTGVAEKLGTYVYALLDPRTYSIFYVGKGRGDRVYSHVWHAMGETAKIRDGVARESTTVRTQKVDRIREIYSTGSRVEHHILRHMIEPAEDSDRTAFAIEQTLIASLRLIDQDSERPTLTNIAAGHTDTELTGLPLDELIVRYAAEPAPDLVRPYVILNRKYPSTTSMSKEQIYEASRGYWTARLVRHVDNLTVVVIHKDIVRAVFQAMEWEQHPTTPSVWAFNGSLHPTLDAELSGKSVKSIRMARSDKNWQQRGWNPYL